VDLALAERFVCPRCSGRIPLVVRADAAVAGDLVAGVAGCPSCHTEWPLTADRAIFGPSVSTSTAVATFDDAEAAIALLRLNERGLGIWLDGVMHSLAGSLVTDAGIRAVLADAVVTLPGALHVDGAPRVPFSPGTFHAALVLRADRSDAWARSVAEALVPRGRMVGTAALAVPEGITELARAGPVWVGERVPPAAPVTLRRR
jgi:hypothetical protein